MRCKFISNRPNLLSIPGDSNETIPDNAVMHDFSNDVMIISIQPCIFVVCSPTSCCTHVFDTMTIANKRDENENSC